MKHYLDELPLYAAGQLAPADALELEEHLRACADCRDELAFWQALSGELQAANAAVVAPPDLAEGALQRIHAGAATQDHATLAARLFKPCQHAFSLLRAQAYLVKREIWPATAGVMALAVITGLLSNHAEAISYVAPLVAAAGLAALYGPEHDPAYELTLAAPTSAWKILLARLSVVSAYNLLLALLASLVMLLIVPPELLGAIILGWLAPMAFLSTLALLLSRWMSASRAIAIAYGLWVLQFMQSARIFTRWDLSAHWGSFLNAYRLFWQSPGLLLLFSLLLLGLALISTRFSERGLNPSAS